MLFFSCQESKSGHYFGGQLVDKAITMIKGVALRKYVFWGAAVLQLSSILLLDCTQNVVLCVVSGSLFE